MTGVQTCALPISIAETEQYTRVGTTALPEATIAGAAVADIVHLLAELIDNGTAFSPHESRVEIRGNVVGRGVVLEIEDQGLGIEDHQRETLNAMLRNPPDFNVMALSNESRVGLFVVARLAGRHGIKISLRDSDYGGTRAIVLIPNSRVADGALETSPESTGYPPAPMPVPPPMPAPVPVDIPSQIPSQPQRNGFPPAKPPLPRRERQTNLAPQLMTDNTPAAFSTEHPAEPHTIDEDESQRRSERMRRTMSAFQQGTRRGRGYDSEIGRH